MFSRHKNHNDDFILRLKHYLKQTFINFYKYLNWCLNTNKPESVYFFTFHRCASTLFGKYVLKNINGLHNIDYALRLYKGKKINNMIFEDKGVIYGPLRLSAPVSSSEYIKLVKPLSDHNFINDKTAIFFIRDPREILISSYFAFKYSHALSPDIEIRKNQEKHREKLQIQTIDDYVIEAAPTLKNQFETLDKISNSCDKSIILRYEDMINNWGKFLTDLKKYIDINNNVLNYLYNNTRPLSIENTQSHRRSGKTNNFRNKLKEETVNILNNTFNEILDKYGYD